MPACCGVIILELENNFSYFKLQVKFYSCELRLRVTGKGRLPFKLEFERVFSFIIISTWLTNWFLQGDQIHARKRKLFSIDKT